jgi:hypothetical protein
MWIELGIFILVLIFAIHQSETSVRNSASEPNENKLKRMKQGECCDLKNMNDESVILL